MGAARQSQAIKKNRLLALLPQAEFERLLRGLKPITLTEKEVLYQSSDRVRYCY